MIKEKKSDRCFLLVSSGETASDAGIIISLHREHFTNIMFSINYISIVNNLEKILLMNPMLL